jgi:hypothetical protein
MSVSHTLYTLSAVLVLVCGGEHMHVARASNCVSDYKEFEKKTFNINTRNRYSLYQVFYPQNQHLPYAVDVIYQTVLPNGVESELEIAYKDPKTNCTITRWRWTSSPIFLLARPKYLNYISVLHNELLQRLDHSFCYHQSTLSLSQQYNSVSVTNDKFGEFSWQVSFSIVYKS